MQEVTIKKDNTVQLQDDILDFLNPKFLFIPIYDGYSVKVRDNDYVYKNDIIAMDKSGKMVYTGVSGKVLGIKTMDYLGGKKIPSIVIENDFKENIRTRKSAKRYINSLSKSDVLNILEDTTLLYRGIDERVKLQNDVGTLIINAVELEPYFKNRYYALKDDVEDLLEMIDLLGTILNSKKILFVIKNTDNDLISKLMDMLGTYPNMALRLVSDAYPNGLGEIQKKIFKEDDARVFDIEEVKDLFEVIKKEQPVTEKLITITGTCVQPKAIVRVKIGSLLSEVFVNKFDFTEKDVDVYLNGLMRGKIVDSLKVVITSDLDGIVVMKKSNLKEEACLNCGLCSKTCPMGLNPKYVFDKGGNVRPEYYDECLKCGLCNYMCPANRDLMSKMGKGN